MTTARRGLVLGAGGVLGYTWIVCALRRLELDTGWDPRTADAIVGTSAGAIVAARLGCGVSTEELLQSHRARIAADRSRAPMPRPTLRLRPSAPQRFVQGLLGRHPAFVALSGLLPEGRLVDTALAASMDALVQRGAWVSHPRCSFVAMDDATGRRVAFGRDDAPPAGLSEAVRASCAVPGWFAPVEIGGRRYLDGSIVSPTSLDLLADEGLDEIIVVSPLTSSRVPAPAALSQIPERAMRVMFSRVLAREIATVERAGTTVRRLEPTAVDLATMGGDFMDPRRRAQVIDAWFG